MYVHAFVLCLYIVSSVSTTPRPYQCLLSLVSGTLIVQYTVTGCRSSTGHYSQDVWEVVALTSWWNFSR